MKKLTKGSSEKNKSNVQLEPIFHQKNFIWDFDGTLFNTYPVMLEALKQAMILNKVSFEGDLAVYIKQHSIKTFAERFANQPFLDDYHRLESELQKRYRPKIYPHLAEILVSIQENGGQNFVLSHRDESTIEYLGLLTSVFREIITSKQSFARKPNPEAILYLVSKYHLNPAETVMVGDRPLDVEAGRNAGVQTLLFDENELFGPIADKKIKNWSEWK
ncbi:HAD-IA family hydrolase [Lactococcus fujiensis]|uniref:HAD-IA family hydrolase n=1 Tax=Lactococcus fujiensis TaxID=610251 RepID=UPI000BDE88A7|nr:HAD-IA family hydrolase [Lactococcus fujiensis]